MTKFKVGDKVKGVYRNGGVGHQFTDENPCIGVITHIKYKYDYYIIDHNYLYLWHENELTLKEKTMEDLKAGDVIEFDSWGNTASHRKILARVEDLFALSESYERGFPGEFATTFEEWLTLDSIKEDNYRLPTKEVTKEMTVAEVEKLVGHKVKIVKG